MKETKLELEEKGFPGIAISRFDSKSCMVSKVNNLDILPLQESDLAVLIECFQKVKPWHKNISGFLTEDSKLLASHYTNGTIKPFIK